MRLRFHCHVKRAARHAHKAHKPAHLLYFAVAAIEAHGWLWAAPVLMFSLTLISLLAGE